MKATVFSAVLTATRPTERSVARKISITPQQIYATDTFRRYPAPISISVGSGVKARIMASGISSAAAAKSIVTAMENRSAIPSTASTARISPLP